MDENQINSIDYLINEKIEELKILLNTRELIIYKEERKTEYKKQELKKTITNKKLKL